MVWVMAAISAAVKPLLVAEQQGVALLKGQRGQGGPHRQGGIPTGAGAPGVPLAFRQVLDGHTAFFRLHQSLAEVARNGVQVVQLPPVVMVAVPVLQNRRKVSGSGPGPAPAAPHAASNRRRSYHTAPVPALPVPPGPILSPPFIRYNEGHPQKEASSANFFSIPLLGAYEKRFACPCAAVSVVL